MKYYTTIIRAINPTTGELCTWEGPIIPAISEAVSGHGKEA